MEEKNGKENIFAKIITLRRLRERLFTATIRLRISNVVAPGHRPFSPGLATKPNF